jgi:hypothetical protein
MPQPRQGTARPQRRDSFSATEFPALHTVERVKDYFRPNIIGKIAPVTHLCPELARVSFASVETAL